MNHQVLDDLSFVSSTFPELWRRLTIDEIPSHEVLWVTIGHMLAQAAMTHLHIAALIGSSGDPSALEQALFRREPRYFCSLEALHASPRNGVLARHPRSVIAALDHLVVGGPRVETVPGSWPARVSILVVGPHHRAEAIDADDAEFPHLSFKRESQNTICIRIRPNLLFLDIDAAIRDARTAETESWDGFDALVPTKGIESTISSLLDAGFARTPNARGAPFD